MTKVNLSNFHFFEGADQLRILNRLVRIHEDLMPHVVTGATGCSTMQAMELLMLLYHSHVADPRLLVYHNVHPDVPIEARRLSSGFPQLPYFCEECEKEVLEEKELSYSFLFLLSESIEFVVEENALR